MNITSASVLLGSVLWFNPAVLSGTGSPPSAPAVSVSASAPTPSSAGTSASATQPAATTTVKRGSLQMKFDATAYFEPVDPVDVRVRPKAYAGELTITSVVANGATVASGAKLLEIDPKPLQKQLDAATNEATVAHANLDKAEADAKIAEQTEKLAMRMSNDAVKDAQSAVKYFEEYDGPDQLRQIDLELKQYTDNVDDRNDELDQLKKMYKSEELTNATADIVVRRAVRGLENAKAGLEMEQHRHERAKTVILPINKRKVYDALTQAKQAHESVVAAQAQAKVVRQAGLVTTRAAVEAADQKVADLKADLEKLTVTAPADGVVWYGQFNQGNWSGGDPKSFKVGEKVAPQAVLMTLYVPGKMRAVMDLQESKFFSVTAGTKVTVTPSAFPELRVQGTCDANARPGVATQSGIIYPLPVTLGDVDKRILPGLRGSAAVDVPPLENVLLVPNSALAGGNVWVRKDGKEEKRPVVTGRSDGKSTEVVGGLNEGDEVLTQAKS